MSFALIPVMVLTFFLSIMAIEYGRATDVLPSTSVTQATSNGQTFIAYSNAVALYQKNNPTFNGTVSGTALAAQGTPFPSDFLAIAGNAITASGTSGHVITCYASLPTGAITAITSAIGNDAAYGTASGTNWTSIAPGATAQPLTTTVPNGAVVSVIQVGT
ncbi:MAG TPA: hypothetical protein VJ654_12955 [Noviherbaspirillum sp.]|nr:hypothetical protein [Noviherbaspirillum sp.]